MDGDEWAVVSRPPEQDWWDPSSSAPRGDHGDRMSSTEPLKVTFGGPATRWTDAIHIGNGRLCAMVRAGVASETLQLNEDTLWTGVPGNYTNPNAPEALAEVRKLVDDGNYREATTEAVKLSGEPSAVYKLLGDIKLEYDYSLVEYDGKTYQTKLHLDTATTRVNYSVGDAEYVGEHFASNPDQVIVTKISAGKSGSLSFTVSLDTQVGHHSYVEGNNRIIMEQNDNPNGVRFTGGLELRINYQL